MAKFISFKLSKEEYLELAQQSFEKGDLEKSISNLKEALKLDERFAEASVLLAFVYAELGAHQISNTVLFSALRYKPDYENESRIFYQLAMNFLEMDEQDVVGYYMNLLNADYEVEEVESDLETNRNAIDGGFRIVYPKGDDYYEMLIEKAYGFLRQHEFDKAIEILREVPENSKCIESANHVTLVCYMMKNDLDRVIFSAQEMLKVSDNLAVKCTLATAYSMEEKTDEALAIIDKILENEYSRVEDILLLLPILVNLNLHVQVVKYTKKVLDKLKLQPNTMIWLSQGLYNIGQKKEAKKVMSRVENIYGDFSPASYFLELYSTQPELVEYSMVLPYTERMRRYKIMDSILKLPLPEFENAIKKADIKELIKWIFDDGNSKLISLFLEKSQNVNSEWLDNLFRKILIYPELSFELMTKLLRNLLKKGFFLEVDLVAQDRYKRVSLFMPETYYKLPKVAREAITYSICDIIFTDETPNEYLEKLVGIVNNIAVLDESGKLSYKADKYKKLAMLKSVKTLVGVMLAKVFEEDENPREDNILRYALNAKNFDKYYTFLFGEKYD